MPLPWNRALVDQLDFQWSNFFRPRLDGLTDDVYLWEPVPGCWSIRRSDERRGATHWTINILRPTRTR